MKSKVVVSFEPVDVVVEGHAEKTLFDLARENGVFVRSECGGHGICGKCRVIVHDNRAVNGLTQTERRSFTEEEILRGLRLACLTTPRKSLVVKIPSESRVKSKRIRNFGLERPVESKPNIEKHLLNLDKPTLRKSMADLERLLEQLESRVDPPAGRLKIGYGTLKELSRTLRHENWRVTAAIWNKEEIISVEPGNTVGHILGVAADIGTSNIVVQLVDLLTGVVLDARGIENPQMMYGEDIISRIAFGHAQDHFSVLQSVVIKAVNQAIDQSCKEIGTKPSDIYKIVIVGNTVMHHLFFGIPPVYVSESPYVPAMHKSICLKAGDLGLRASPQGIVHSLPIVGGFVGPDAIADILAVGMNKSRENRLLLDIGTNTEIFVGNRSLMHCCSCASGPAFEGVNITHGVKAVDGAIESVSIDLSHSAVRYDTVADAPPVGICGTGIIDAVAEMLKAKIITGMGRFSETAKTANLKEIHGEKRFVLVPKEKSQGGAEITISQKDINQIQLAKAAVFAACWLLLRKACIPLEDIDQVFIAGAFGTHLNAENAKVLGLIPDFPTEKIMFAGNTASSGAKMALLSTEVKEEAEQLAKTTAYWELADDPRFAEEFTEALYIPHKELSRFPSIKQLLEKR